MPVTIKLSKPITIAGAEAGELNLREPLGANVRLCGETHTFQYPGGEAAAITRVDTEVIARYIATLAGISPAAVNQLAAPDFNACEVAILGFFRPGAPASSSPPTTMQRSSGATTEESSD